MLSQAGQKRFLQRCQGRRNLVRTMSSELIHVIAAVITDDRGRFLVCRRPAAKRHGGLWEFPGGKIEPGETYLQAAQRELAEELGVWALSLGETRFSNMDPGSEFQIDFVPTIIEGEPQPLEHSDLRWVPLPELLAFDLAPSDRRFVDVILSRAASAADSSPHAG